MAHTSRGLKARPRSRSEQSNPELLIDFQAMLAAVAHVMIDEPEHIQSFEQIVLIVVELKRSIQIEERLHAVGIVADQGVNRAGSFLDVAARAGDPVILQITPVAFERACEDWPAMLVAAEDAALLYPQNVGVGVMADIEGNVANEDIFHERHVGRFSLASADVNVRKRIFPHHRIEITA